MAYMHQINIVLSAQFRILMNFHGILIVNWAHQWIHTKNAPFGDFTHRKHFPFTQVKFYHILNSNFLLPKLYSSVINSFMYHWYSITEVIIAYTRISLIFVRNISIGFKRQLAVPHLKTHENIILVYDMMTSVL